MIPINTSGLLTIDLFNRLTGRDTLHPLICLIDLSQAELNEDIRMKCNFYGLLYYNSPPGNANGTEAWLRKIGIIK